MTRVVHLSSVHYPFDTRIFHRQLRSLAEAGYETTLLAHHDESTVRDGVRIESVGDVDSRTERWRNLLTMFDAARRADADIYHFHDPELLPIGVLLGLSTDGKVVYDIHEDYADAIRVREWIPDALKMPLTTAFPIAQGVATKALDLVVTADASIQDQLERRTSTPVVAVRNFPRVSGIDLESEGTTVERSHEYVLTYVGGLDRERGLLEMLRVTARLRDSGLDVGLWLLGPFQDEEIKARAQAYMESTAITNHVRLFGYVDYEDIFAYLSAADVGLLLADEERFARNVPTKFFEYLYAELPVVSTEIPSLEPYRSEAYCRTVTQGDSEAAVEVIAEVLHDSERRAKMGAAGHDVVSSKYNWEREQERLLEAYRQLARP